MTQQINEGTRKSRKPHQCFHCYRTIPKAELYHYSTCVCDHIYTLKMHIDCDKFATEYMERCGGQYCDFYDGYPPVVDLISDGLSRSEIGDLFNKYRGFYPHVITRIEHNWQEEDIRYEKRTNGRTQ